MIKRELTPNTKYYRYRLNSNYKGESISINSKIVRKSWGCESIYKANEFIDYLRTNDNKKGIVDFERFNSTTEEIYESSVSKLKNNDNILYTRQELESKSISDVVDIAKKYSINILNKDNIEIIDIILSIQDQILEKYNNLYDIYGV